jgi:hypothetical protein
MPEIVVDAPTEKLIKESPVVAIRNQTGEIVGFVTQDLMEDFLIARQRRENRGRGYSLDEALEQIRRKYGD